MVEPILKWAGGKRQLIEEILSLSPRDHSDRSFHEPMFGGGAVTFKLEPSSGTINDVNSRLVNFYRVVRDRPEELIRENRRHPHEEEYYYEARDRFNKRPRGEGFEGVEEASLLLYLNRTGFNGLYRENSKGEFNVPFGRYANPDYVCEKRIRRASKVLDHIEIYNRDFSYIAKEAQKGDLVYFDPPYQPVSDTANFTQYSMDDFDLEDQARLAEVCKELDEREVLFVLSNSNAPDVRGLYEEDFVVETVGAKRSINSDGANRGEVKEILVTNVPEERRVGMRRQTRLSAPKRP